MPKIILEKTYDITFKVKATIEELTASNVLQDYKSYVNRAELDIRADYVKMNERLFAVIIKNPQLTEKMIRKRIIAKFEGLSISDLIKAFGIDDIDEEQELLEASRLLAKEDQTTINAAYENDCLYENAEHVLNRFSVDMNSVSIRETGKDNV